MYSLSYFNDEEMMELARSEDPTVQKLAAIIRGLSQALLLQSMRAMGESYLADRDASGLDVALWRALVEVPERMSDDEVSKLEQLSQQAGGWWKLSTEPEFMDHGAWGDYYTNATKPTL